MVRKVDLPLVDGKTRSVMGTCFESGKNKTSKRDLHMFCPSYSGPLTTTAPFANKSYPYLYRAPDKKE